MRRLNVRQGVIGGGVVSVICAASAAGRSADPIPTFAEFLAVGVAVSAIAALLAIAINRPSGPPIRW